MASRRVAETNGQPPRLRIGSGSRPQENVAQILQEGQAQAPCCENPRKLLHPTLCPARRETIMPSIPAKEGACYVRSKCSSPGLAGPDYLRQRNCPRL